MGRSLLSTLAFALYLQGALSFPGDAYTKRANSIPASSFLGGAPRAVDQNGQWEYIVVGSGAGGGPLAARLALNGKRVLLIDAGDDQSDGRNLNVTVPTFHAYSTEDDRLAWDFYVRHYADEARQRQDSKFAYQLPDGSKYVGLNPPPGAQPLGILYPRTGTLGGCTAHNALVNVYNHRKDWSYIQQLTGDKSWDPDNMRRIYADKIEKLDYSAPTSPGHGYNGWLGVGKAENYLALNDTKILGVGVSAAAQMGGETAVIPILGDALQTVNNIGRILAGDANSGDLGRDQREGVFPIPLAEYNHRRNGARDFVMSVFAQKKYPLDIMLNTLVTKVNFAAGTNGAPRAVGVNFLRGKSLYRADARSGSAGPGTPGTAGASAEVILAGGAFNTPQLLKLSGIGPREELQRFNIPVVVNLPGVGTNLQDHMEIGVTHQSADPFAVIERCSYNRQQPDICLQNWKDGVGPYASSNGFFYAMIKKTSVADQDVVYGDDPDLLIFGGIADFRGYYPGYSNDVYGYNNFTWVILKAHTGNYGPKAGTVKLRSADPRDTPDILFNFFDAGRTDNGAANRDLQAMSEGIDLSRAVNDNARILTGPAFVRELHPGKNIVGNAAQQEHIKREAWSHHASCTAAIGADNDPYAVLDGKLRVRGTQGLRVADASVFPRIPGFFVAVPTYMIGEKCAESILTGA